MGIFDKIKSAIWGEDEAAAVATGTPEDSYLGTTASTTGIAPDVATQADNPVMADVAAAGVQPVSKPAPIEMAQNPATRPTEVDVAEQLDRAMRDRGEKLDWRHSIVDLMKALGMDASLQERKELAKELNYQGDMGDSAKMNMYLHKTLLQRLSENGGKVPADLLD
ncbi:DUF3597 domain-containing protein [Rhizobium sp. LjRoot254]|uniref:DUF3597 domain-containing protein n=1 Tax=Rhizobium sp. LjRoot254 TaxID=3342297 RepID=UPI003ECD16C3